MGLSLRIGVVARLWAGWS